MIINAANYLRLMLGVVIYVAMLVVLKMFENNL